MKKLRIGLFAALLLVCLLLSGCGGIQVGIDTSGEIMTKTDYEVIYHGFVVQAGTGFVQVLSNWRAFHNEEEFQRFVQYQPIDVFTPLDKVDFSKQDLYYYGYPRGFDATSDVSHNIKAVYIEPYFDIVFEENPAEGVAYQILPNDDTNVCVREVWLLTIPKPAAK